MGSPLNELSPDALDHIERARARERQRGERRELLTEVAVGLLFVLSAGLLALTSPHTGAWGTALLLVVVYHVLLRVSFEVGEGVTTPVQLAYVPMLLLLPPAL